MKKRAKKSRTRKIIDLCIYCVAVLFLFFAVVLFMQELIFVPEEVYQDPPPPAQVYVPRTPMPQISYSPTEYPTFYDPPDETAAETISRSPDNTEANATPRPTPAPTTPIFSDDDIYPVKLYFIEQKVSCEVLPVRINKNYQMDTIRSAYKAGWLYEPPYVVPGDIGKAIIAGHNRWQGKAGTFSVLKKMKPGEQVAVEMNDGYARYFTVDEILEYPYNDNTIMQAVYDRPVLILITCKGDWSNALHTSKTRVVAICSPMQ